MVVGATVAREFVDYASRTRWRWRLARAPSSPEPSYAHWLESQRPSVEEVRRQRHRIRVGAIGVGVDCLVLAGDEQAALSATIRSLRSQTLQDWSATVSGPSRSPLLRDERVTVDGRDGSGLLGRMLTSGDPRRFIVVLEAGDVLEPDLLFHIAARAWDDPQIDLVHWDNDVIEQAEAVGDPRIHPGWSPEMLLSANYLGRSFAVRRERLASVRELPDKLDGAAYWRLLLALGLGEETVARVPRLLQHVVRQPDPVPLGAKAIVAEQLERAGREADVDTEGGAVRIRWRLDPKPSVTIVIPTRSRETLLARCLEGIERTDYPHLEIVVIDSGEKHADAERFYRDRSERVNLDVVWWEGPFNYSAANNLGARTSNGDVLIFLNDDTQLTEPDWVDELVGWAAQPGVGLAGLQLVGGQGRIQHGGIVVGMNGFADHLFAGMRPGEDSMLGSTRWYRNCLSVTAACVGVKRRLFEAIGGFDERFVFCGSDVVLGLDARFHGCRSVCSPFGGVRHLEAETRGEDIPADDFFSSYWRYQRWLRGGDPYFSPNLSLTSTRPRLRTEQEAGPMEAVGGMLNRPFSVFRQTTDEDEGSALAAACRADTLIRDRVRSANTAAQFPVRTVNWFLPDIDSPYYGGINTALRIADHLARVHGVANQFVVAADANEPYIRSALRAVFPSLGGSPIAFNDGRVGPGLQTMPAADVSIATHWHTAYLVANFNRTRRRFYLIQDFEPLFHPAGTGYALAEETYRLGLHGVCNTEHMLRLVQQRYDAEGIAFMPAIDTSVFHPAGRRSHRAGEPVTIFTYARPGHWRNCWELASLALRTIKRRLGERVRIVTAGSWARPDDLGLGIEHLGLLDYRDTGELYRQCDLGLVLTVSEHPSYLPLELLACGTPVVAFDNPAGDWILRHEENCLRCPRTVDGLVEGLERLATDQELRDRLARQGIADIKAGHADWEAAIAGIYDYLCQPAAAPRQGHRG